MDRTSCVWFHAPGGHRHEASRTSDPQVVEVAVAFETLTVREEGAVLFADIAAPPMNLIEPEMVRDLVSKSC